MNFCFNYNLVNYLKIEKAPFKRHTYWIFSSRPHNAGFYRRVLRPPMRKNKKLEEVGFTMPAILSFPFSYFIPD